MKHGYLGDFIDFAYGKGLPARERKSGLVPVFGSAGRVDTHDQAFVEGPGVIVGRKGTIGSVHWSEGDFFPIDTTYYVIPRSDQVQLRYIYYLLKTLPLQQMNTDVAVPGLNRTNALRLTIAIPPLSTQERITATLDAYDDLIENNRRRIRLLEEAARLLYREWFVHLRFPGHEHVAVVDGVPAGWERKRLGDVAPLHYGKGLRQNERIPGPFPVYGSSGVVGTHVNALVPGPTIIVGRKGNVGSVFWSPEDCHPIDTVYYIDKEHCSLYLYYVLLHLSFLSTDVAVPGLNRNYAHSRSLLVPDSLLFRLFEDTVGPLHRQMDVLRKQSSALSKARDILLPRVMNGEISL